MKAGRVVHGAADMACTSHYLWVGGSAISAGTVAR